MGQAEVPSIHERFGAQFERALATRRGGDLNAAVEELRLLCLIDPGHLGARCELAFTLHFAGASAEAEALCLSALEADPHFPSALGCLGNICRHRGDIPAALAYFQRAAQAAPGNEPILCEIAWCLTELARPDEAETVLHDILALDPRSVPALRGLAHHYQTAKRDSAALFVFRLLARDDPTDLEVQCEIAFGLTRRGRREEAEATFQAVLDSDPQRTIAYRGLAQIAADRRDPKAAIEVLEEARRRACLDDDGLVQLAAALADAGQAGQAAEALESVLSRSPEHSEALMALGHARRALGNREAALAAFKAAAAREPSRALPEAASELRALGRPREALDALNQTTVVDPVNFNANLQLSELARAAGRWAECIARCERLITLHPDRIEPRAEICRALAQSDRKDEAMDMARRFEAMGLPATPGHLVRLEIARACNDVNFAREALAAAARSTDEDFELWLARVATYVAMGDTDGARAVLDRPVISGRAADAGRLKHLRAQLASLEWRVEEAIEGFNASIENAQINPDAHFNLSRLHYLRAEVEPSVKHLELFLTQAATDRILRGQSIRLSQNLAGQLLNEMKTDPQLLDLLREAASETGFRRIDILLRIARSFPQSTPAAQMLLLALRTSGAFDGVGDLSSAEGDGAIPRVIFQYWPDDEPPEAVRRGFEVCRDLHPGWRHVRFNRRSGLAWVRDNCAPDVWAACSHAVATSQFEALLRLAVLNLEGGYFIDAAARCMSPLDTAPGAGATLLVWQEEFSALSDALLACAPAETVVARALTLAAEAMNRGDSDIPWLATGPGLLGRAFAQEIAALGESWKDGLGGRFIGDRAAFHRVLAPDYVAPR